MLLAQLYGIDESAFRDRDPKFKDMDIAVARAIAQAACEVELFTIPLYMTSLYSIQGFHQITSAGNDFYAGRQWPGAKTTAVPRSANDKAFNIIFSVFVQEMLHLQLAANMATTIGAVPDFTSSSLQNDQHGWTCYGPDNTTIPHVIDLKDTLDYDDVAVNVGPLNKETIRLFIAIEEPEKEAEKFLKPGVPPEKYFPPRPLDDWKEGDPLPLFGTIGYMYQYYAAYLQITYSDRTRLWDAVFAQAPAQQNDMFNNFVAGGHPMREYLGFEATVAQVYPDVALKQMLDMMDAICDQGEGATLPFKTRKLSMSALDMSNVEARYQSTYAALESDYPSYDQNGNLISSADAEARFANDPDNHYERFIEIKNELLADVVTWPDWLAKHGKWTPDDFIAKGDGAVASDSKLPDPKDTANAMNELADKSDSHRLLSQVVVGAIAGITTVLDDYWNARTQAKSPVSFPMPSMVGSGDRMAVCWAVTGRTPDLSIGLEPPKSGTLYHACQGLSWDYDGGTVNDCAAVAIFHTCRGSNGCHAQGGCGFAQPYGGGSSCGAKASGGGAGELRGTAGYMRRVGEPAMQLKASGMCGGPTQAPGYQPASDNKCQTFGGCAVPISAYQLYPVDGTMALYSFETDASGVGGYMSKQIFWGTNPAAIPFHKGDAVHDIAYRAYRTAMGVQDPNVKVPEQPPAANTLRLVFPPST
jgi:hypothetical protein